MPGTFRLRQLRKSPRRHARHVPSWPPCQPTPARCPFFHSDTPAPTSSTVPETSCPGTRGYSMPGHKPSLVNMSLWQTPQACTLIRTCSGPGWGISRSTIWKSAPALGITATFIGATATLLVAICPPMLHRIVVEVHLLFSSMNVAIEKRQALSKIYSSLLRCVMGEDKVVRLNRLMRDPSALHSPAFAHVGSSVPTCSATMYLAY